MITELGVIRLSNGNDLDLPAYETDHAAGMDLRAAIPIDEPLLLAPTKRVLVPTGFIFEIPVGFEGQIRPRSGLAYKNGITCLNTPGTIDADYRGEVKVLLINHGEQSFEISRGMRIGQIIIAPLVKVQVIVREEISDTDRGTGGFGSTGL